MPLYADCSTDGLSEVVGEIVQMGGRLEASQPARVIVARDNRCVEGQKLN